jgi:hypothetical protein
MWYLRHWWNAFGQVKSTTITTQNLHVHLFLRHVSTYLYYRIYLPIYLYWRHNNMSPIEKRRNPSFIFNITFRMYYFFSVKSYTFAKKKNTAFANFEYYIRYPITKTIWSFHCLKMLLVYEEICHLSMILLHIFIDEYNIICWLSPWFLFTSCIFTKSNQKFFKLFKAFSLKLLPRDF